MTVNKGVKMFGNKNEVLQDGGEIKSKYAV